MVIFSYFGCVLPFISWLIFSKLVKMTQLMDKCGRLFCQNILISLVKLRSNKLPLLFRPRTVPAYLMPIPNIGFVVFLDVEVMYCDWISLCLHGALVDQQGLCFKYLLTIPTVTKCVHLCINQYFFSNFFTGALVSAACHTTNIRDVAN